MTPTVHILATVRQPALLPAATLVCRTLRIGFPTATAAVWGNGLSHAAAAAVQAAGVVQVLAGGAARGSVVNSGGYEQVNSGASTSGSTLDAGGTEYVVAGGVASAVTLSGGTLELVTAGGAVGSILFAGSGGLLKIDSTSLPSAVISGFLAGDSIDLVGVAYAGMITTSAGVASLSLTGVAGTVSLNLAGAALAGSLQFHADATGGTTIA